MYDAVADEYCYSDTAILQNRLGLRNQARLDAYELEVSTLRAAEPLPQGRFTLRHYQAIHRHLFQDVYSWAGQIRTVRIAKGASMFCYPENIEGQLGRVLGNLRAERHLKGLTAAQFAERAAEYLAELNAIHPFREGNGRTQLAFLALLAARAGHPLDLDRLDPQNILTAMIESFDGNHTSLRSNIADLLHRPA